MTLTQVFGSLLVFILCPILGALPVVRWVKKILTFLDPETSQRGFPVVEIALEASQGAIAVLLARQFFPTQPEWEIIAAMALVMGNYWARRRVNTMGVVGAIVVHDWLVAALVFIVGTIGLTILRERQQGRLGILILFPVMVWLLHGDGARGMAAATLSGLLLWLYHQLPPEDEPLNSSALFGFFRPDKALVSLEQPLKVDRVGQNAATLSQLQRWGYPVPPGWVLLPGDDPEPLLKALHPSQENPLTVSASPLGHDPQYASAAGQYLTIAGITSRDALEAGISQCLASYDRPSAIEYRQELEIEEDAMAVLVLEQVREVFSGVAFSRDPIERHGDAAIVETQPGELRRVTSGEVTPERYRVFIPPEAIEASLKTPNARTGTAVPGTCDPPPLEIEAEIQGTAGDVPPVLLRQVAWLVRHLEVRYQQIPQSIEWSYDGRRLWVLQCYPIATLRPIWTRDVALEWFRGTLHPLSWSVHRPLLVEAWEQVSSLFLGDRAAGFNFNEIASFHDSRVYFNAFLVQKMGWRKKINSGNSQTLKSRPFLQSINTIRQLSIEFKWLKYRVNLYDRFTQIYKQTFERASNQPQPLHFRGLDGNRRSISEIGENIDNILSSFKILYHHHLFITLSIQKWQKRLGIQDRELDRTRMPEMQVKGAILQLAIATRHLLPDLDLNTPLDGECDLPALFARLSENEEGRNILEEFDRLLDLYGYWNESGIDLAEPTWQENPHEARELFAQFVWERPTSRKPPRKPMATKRWRAEQVQKLINIHSKERQLYHQLFAQLRWHFLTLERDWLAEGLLARPGDIFFLTIYEVRGLMTRENIALRRLVPQLIAGRRSQFQQDCLLATVPDIVYGNATPTVIWSDDRANNLTKTLQGIGASPGLARGRVQVLRGWQSITRIDRETIWVLPYLDPSWTHLFARAGGLIAQTGGQLSHGAIVAREYGIPAAIDIDGATRRLRDGQRVQLDGTRGIVTILEG